MHLEEKISVNAMPEQVWPFLVEPAIEAAWNSDIVSMQRDKIGPVEVGEQFEMVFHVVNQEWDVQVECTDVQINRRLAYRHSAKNPKGNRINYTISYDIEPVASGIDITRVRDIEGIALPGFIRFLIKLFGKRKKPPLDRLRMMIEQELS